MHFKVDDHLFKNKNFKLKKIINWKNFMSENK